MTYKLQHHPSQTSRDASALSLGASEHTRRPIQPTTIGGYPGAGIGRVVRFPSAVPLMQIIHRIVLGIGIPRGFPVAVPQGKTASDMRIRSVGICAGSGGHVFGEMDKAGEDVDLLFTGELGHHEALAAIERGRCVIALFHSNTERGFLHAVMKSELEAEIRMQVGSLVKLSRRRAQY